jgi:hypothetical protein
MTTLSICVDNGCVHHTRKAAGLDHLVALDLDPMDIVAQENIEFKKQLSIHFKLFSILF